jgi:very-short-patch-repair endonuclease
VGEVFRGSAALRDSALTEHQLRRWYRPIFRDIYVPRDSQPSLNDRIIGAWLWSRQRAVVAGAAAAALHGAAWVDEDIPIELIGKSARSQRGLLVRNEALDIDEIVSINRLRVTSAVRTAFDLGRYLPRGAAVAQLDALMRATRFSSDDVSALAHRYKGARGLRRLKAALPLVDAGAMSPKETWLRLLLRDAGLPEPSLQIPLVRRQRLIAVFDLGWDEYKVAAEYDGDYHRSDRGRFVKDIDKLSMAEEQGWLVIRVVAEHRPATVVSRVYRALTSRGWHPDRRQRDALSRFTTLPSISA